MKYVLGKNLKVGMTIKVWWTCCPHVNGTCYHGRKPNEDMITKLFPYKGNFSHLWPKGLRNAALQYFKVGKLIINDEYYEVIS